MRKRIVGSISVAMLMLPALLLGCEEDLNLREDYPEPFTLYGLLSPDLGIQSVRVYPLEAFPQLDSVDPQAVRFTSTDLSTGEQILWQDSILTADNGQQDLIFWSSFRPKHDHVYRVEATRLSDGAGSYADVRIPLRVVVRSEDIVSPEPNIATLRIIVEGADIQVHKPEITYEVIAYSGSQFYGSKNAVTLPHHNKEKPIEQGWEIPINIWLDRQYVQGTLRAGIRPFSFMLNDVRIRFMVGNADWDPPTGRFDINLLSHQNALNNVVNGLGFVGGGYRVVEQIVPGCDLVTDAQYICRGDLFP